jgi:hypothetical protein
MVTKVDLVLFLIEKAVPQTHGLLPLGGDHVTQFGYLTVGAIVINDIIEQLNRSIAYITSAISGNNVIQDDEPYQLPPTNPPQPP